MSIGFLNEWYICNNVIDKKTCNKIKRLSNGAWDKATIRLRDESFEQNRGLPLKRNEGINSNRRITDVCWTNEQWVYDLIWPYMQEANNTSGWNLDISAAESTQIGRYRKGGFYAWHKDGSADSLAAYDTPENEFTHGNVRKISMSLILNDSFEGGEFEFCCYDGGECEITPIELKAGDMIFFLSGMEHRVTPVTKGVRYSLVSWFLGPPIR
jgi:PKHD-type hydroxylase